ncbi:MAG: OmpA family protein [Pseudomonadota bacterium]
MANKSFPFGGFLLHKLKDAFGGAGIPLEGYEMHNRFALMAAVSAVALGSAFAQSDENTGYYGELGGSYTLDWGVKDFESEGLGVDEAFDSELEVDEGFGVYGALGKYFPGNLRSEVEIGYRGQDIDYLPTAPGRTLFGAGDDFGEVGVLTGMINVYKDLPLGLSGRVTPYVGAGIGFARVSLDMDNEAVVAASASPGSFNSIDLDDDDYVTAVQGMAGVTVDVARNLAFALGYRYLQTGEYDMEGTFNGADETSFSGEYNAHEITAGLRFNFGGGKTVEPAVATAAPAMKTCVDGTVVALNAPCPVAADDEAVTAEELSLVVYFEYDSAALTDRARSAIARRARQAQDVDLISVVVIGNTDTAGSAQYNVGLSQRRARVVRDALASYGVDSSKISVRALGETTPAKATGDGVAEPLNRRTEVEFEF